MMFAAIVLFFIAGCSAHTTLVFPPARPPSYDFLDNVRTGGPCGVPYPGDDNAVLTTFAAGSTINVQFHLAYPHRGGILVNLLWSNGTVAHKVFDNWSMHNDTTSTSVQITLPTDFTCDRCILQLLRQAGEWTANGGYVFWTCSDISIKESDTCNGGDCSGNGVCSGGTCSCNKLYHGEFCQLKDDCEDATDCNNHGSCMSVSSVKAPRKQCFCSKGWFGRYCADESSVSEVLFDESDYTIKRNFGRLNMWSRLVNNNNELEVVLSVNATGFVAVGFRPPNMDGSCRDEAPGPFRVGANPHWPNGTIQGILGVSGVFVDGGASQEEEEEEEEQQQEEEEQQQEEEENTQEEEEEEEEEEEGGAAMHAMDCTDIIIGTARGNQHRILDYYTRDRSTPMLDEQYGGSQDLTGAVGEEVDGITTIKFRRKLVSSDTSGDHNINDALFHVIWSFGQIYPDYMHNPGSGIESGTAMNDRFYQPDEIKYHGSRNRGAASINFFIADPIAGRGCEGNYNSSCTGDVCDYTASWSVKGDAIKFTISAKIMDDEYAAIGFSNDIWMADSDVVVGASNGRQSFVQDRWSTARGVMPRLDNTDNLEGVSISRENGFTTFSFTRRLDTNDTRDDLVISDNTVRFIYTWGGSFNYDTRDIGRHPMTPIVSTGFINIPTTCEGSHFEAGSGAGYMSVSMMLLSLLGLISYVFML